MKHSRLFISSYRCKLWLAFRLLRWTPVFAGAALLCVLSIQPVLADPYTYAPEDCEFTMQFPAAPGTGNRCHPDDPKQCHDVVSYVKVFDMASTVTFDVTCNKIGKGLEEQYNEDVMKTTLIAMGGRGRLEEFETGYDQKPEARIAHILGHGERNGQDLIYMAQLWVGKSSIFTIEAEVSGGFVDAADDLFARTLASVSHKDWVKKEEEKSEEPAKPDDKKPEKETGEEKKP